MNVIRPVTRTSDGMSMLRMLGSAVNESAPVTFVSAGMDKDVI